MQYQKKIFVLIFVFCLCGFRASAQTPKKPNEIAREQSKAVVVVEALDERGSIIGQGSGFIVTPNGAVVSNLHVVRGAAGVSVKLPSGDVYKTADLVDVDEAKDIVIIKIKGFKLPTVTLGDSDKVETGDAIVAISSPEGLTNSLSTGVVSGVRRMETHRVFQITAPISRGSSGGALFNANGEIIGIVTSLLKSGQNINFAVPINYARGMIGDQVSTSLARLQPLQPPSAKKEVERKTSDIYDTDEPIQPQITTAARGKLGRTQQEPVFARPDEALALFYRLVEGIGLYTNKEPGELLRSAALMKTADTDQVEEYTVQYLTFFTGLRISFSKPERLLSSVEMLVTWSESDLKNTFGDKFKRRTVGNQKVLEFGKQPGGRQMVATLDGN
ncbi:MAG TPA: trypsin-like peptidase domain-containing protein, partial [Blastocatellia bacterium]|nr:trypsin-like peptidase domain-containing protein [Blastocatellia bacterium]